MKRERCIARAALPRGHALHGQQLLLRRVREVLPLRGVRDCGARARGEPPGRLCRHRLCGAKQPTPSGCTEHAELRRWMGCGRAKEGGRRRELRGRCAAETAKEAGRRRRARRRSEAEGGGRSGRRRGRNTSAWRVEHVEAACGCSRCRRRAEAERTRARRRRAEHCVSRERTRTDARVVRRRRPVVPKQARRTKRLRLHAPVMKRPRVCLALAFLPSCRPSAVTSLLGVAGPFSLNTSACPLGSPAFQLTLRNASFATTTLGGSAVVLVTPSSPPTSFPMGETLAGAAHCWSASTSLSAQTLNCSGVLGGQTPPVLSISAPCVPWNVTRPPPPPAPPPPLVVRPPRPPPQPPSPPLPPPLPPSPPPSPPDAPTAPELTSSDPKVLARRGSDATLAPMVIGGLFGFFLLLIAFRMATAAIAGMQERARARAAEMAASREASLARIRAKGEGEKDRKSRGRSRGEGARIQTDV